MEPIGFFVCVDDLEDELIRAVGTMAVENIVSEAVDAAPLLTFRHRPG